MPDSFSTPGKPVEPKPKRVQVRAGPKFSVNGRPGKRTPALEKQLLAVLSKGVPIRVACLAVGISEDSFADWRRKDPELERRVGQARGRMAARLVAKIEKQTEQNFSAAAWLLERNFPSDFARPEIQHQISTYHNTVNSTSIVISAELARTLEERSTEVSRTVSQLFAQRRERAKPTHDSDRPEPEPPSVYGQITIPPAIPSPSVE
jgi:hypothetical protein